ncbi:MAG TPA: Gfo/Idh/MocA family oxidoreductase [Acidimicrobiia bacterium]|nr:Gfo/Idh/MocA family oxidoreductase [Acidimicrobiia bacterium]
MIRWGIAGPGEIATRFAEGMRELQGGAVVAVGSRSVERAQAFAARFEIPRSFGSYEALAEDPDVDAVYVATPHSRHAADTLLFLSAGKHVLCEKPFALNTTQAQAMIAAADAGQRFLMEAMWSRFLPAYRELRALLDEGRVGDPLLVEASFGWRGDVVPAHRHFDLDQGGGALLDLGVYTVNLSQFVLGPVESIVARGHVGDTGVDEHVAAVLQHADDRLGVVQAAIRTPLTCTARIACTAGVIDIPAFMHCPDHLVVVTPAGEERIDTSWDGEGLRFQVEEVHRCLAAGLIESAVMPWSETLGIARVLDEIRAQVGVRYPGE